MTFKLLRWLAEVKTEALRRPKRRRSRSLRRRQGGRKVEEAHQTCRHRQGNFRRSFFPSDYITNSANRRHYNANDPKARRNISMYMEVNTTLLIITGEARPSNKQRKNDKTTKMYTLSCGTVKVAGKRFESIFGGFNGGHKGSDGGYLDESRSLRQTVQYSSNINSYADLNFEASTERNLGKEIKQVLNSEWWGGGCEGFDGGFEESREGCERGSGRKQKVAEAITEPPPNPKITSISMKFTSVSTRFLEAAGTVGEGVKNPKYSFEQMKTVRVAKPGMFRRWEEAREGQGRA
ncbi:hypothetical protein R3P38DRAFT_3440475 [Favolaschia claudopus]|uniref:Uncharacterized protein n=1 Tax=Favolaschia claudopus TaxID=2862362 RepID=A0AAW0CUA6_9AGAR